MKAIIKRTTEGSYTRIEVLREITRKDINVELTFSKVPDNFEYNSSRHLWGHANITLKGDLWENLAGDTEVGKFVSGAKTDCLLGQVGMAKAGGHASVKSPNTLFSIKLNWRGCKTNGDRQSRWNHEMNRERTMAEADISITIQNILDRWNAAIKHRAEQLDKLWTQAMVEAYTETWHSMDEFDTAAGCRPALDQIEMLKAQVAGLEDMVQAKRCDHRIKELGELDADDMHIFTADVTAGVKDACKNRTAFVKRGVFGRR